MKKILNVFIVVLFIFILCMSAVASDDCPADIVVSLQIDNPSMTVNGESYEIDPGRGTCPVVINNRTLVPIRAIIESFGGQVSWIEESETVVLTMNDDILELVINSNTAYFNDIPYVLDVAPAVINDRTMLPIRFVSESFNLAVAWEEITQTVYVIRNGLDNQEYEYLEESVPEYSGKPYAEINGNVPMFKSYEIIDATFEYYSSLDDLGRCNVCFASVSEDIMPTEPRGDISSVKPTGWINKSYDFVDGKYIYNRCHLIGFQLTGENANEKNLITGTRYINVDAMLPFENLVDDYIEKTGNSVMYRVTPVFDNENLVADGVLMEAYSVEDAGEGISFCVYCYNVQPGITIDYKTGENYASLSEQYNQIYSGEFGIDIEKDFSSSFDLSDNITNDGTVYKTPTGKRYHYDAQCGGKNSFEVTLNEAISSGLTPCSKCVD